jgi:hypothetical protein
MHQMRHRFYGYTFHTESVPNFNLSDSTLLATTLHLYLPITYFQHCNMPHTPYLNTTTCPALTLIPIAMFIQPKLKPSSALYRLVRSPLQDTQQALPLCITTLCGPHLFYVRHERTSSRCLALVKYPWRRVTTGLWRSTNTRQVL